EFVLIMKAIPALARFDAPAAARKFMSSIRTQHAAPLPGTAEAGDWEDKAFAVRAYRLPATVRTAFTIGELRGKAPRISIERVRRDVRWLSLDQNTALQAGDEVVIGAPLDAQVRVRELLGPELPDVEARALSPVHTVDVVVSRNEAAGHSLANLRTDIGPG